MKHNNIWALETLLPLATINTVWWSQVELFVSALIASELMLSWHHLSQMFGSRGSFLEIVKLKALGTFPPFSLVSASLRLTRRSIWALTVWLRIFTLYSENSLSPLWMVEIELRVTKVSWDKTTGRTHKPTLAFLELLVGAKNSKCFSPIHSLDIGR